MGRYRALLAYDGTDFCGYQRQAAGRSVQGEVEAALGRISNQPAVPVLAAGRTDSGVHASGQVIAFDLDWVHGAERLCAAINAHLALDVAVQKVEVAGADFHPRFAAKLRRYEYQIYNAAVRLPRTARSHWNAWPELDVKLMGAGANALLGEHDFATFGTAPEGGGTTVRTVTRAAWSNDGAVLLFEIAADGFLYCMVRSIVGSLCQVGWGAWPVGEIERRLAACDRKLSGSAAPAHGLSLVAVEY